jgi:hypothetical protein
MTGGLREFSEAAAQFTISDTANLENPHLGMANVEDFRATLSQCALQGLQARVA